MKLLVPYDGSPQSDKALDTAVHLAQGMGGTIVVVNVVPDLCLMSEEIPAGDCDAVSRALDMNGSVALHRADEKLKGSGVEVETVMKSGRIVDSILDVAQERSIDCIVIGAHGRHKALRMLLGSVSSKVAELSSCNVLIVK